MPVGKDIFKKMEWLHPSAKLPEHNLYGGTEALVGRNPLLWGYGRSEQGGEGEGALHSVAGLFPGSERT